MMESVFSLKYLRSSTECKKKHDTTGHFQERLKLGKNHGRKSEKGCDSEPVEGSPSCMEDPTEIQNP